MIKKIKLQANEEMNEEVNEDEIEEDGKVQVLSEEDLEDLRLYKYRFESVLSHDNPYYQFISNIMQKTQVMKLKQLISFVSKKFRISELKANEIVLEAQRYNYIIITTDDFVMTNGYYLTTFDDQFFDGLTYNNYITHYEKGIRSHLTKDELKKIDCYTIVLEMMPVSENFFIANSPWDVMFITPDRFVTEEKPGCVYEIIYICHENSVATCYALGEKYRERNEETEPYIKRIAVLENEDDVIKVPYVGFTNIVKINNGKIKFLEDRGENPWG